MTLSREKGKEPLRPNAYVAPYGPGSMTIDKGVSDDPCTIERKRFEGCSLTAIVVCVTASAVSVTMLVLTFVNGAPSMFQTLVYSAYVVITVPIVAWEIADARPARVELGHDNIRLSINGRTVTEIALDGRVRVDVSLKSDIIAPPVQAFSTCCDAPIARPRQEGWMMLCGISLTKDGTTINIHHEKGWKLKDIIRLWGPFIDVVLDRDMQMGADLRRYHEFRQGVGTAPVEEEQDIFARIRAMGTDHGDDTTSS
jgi:hypothetical protein